MADGNFWSQEEFKNNPKTEIILANLTRSASLRIPGLALSGCLHFPMGGAYHFPTILKSESCLILP